MPGTSEKDGSSDKAKACTKRTKVKHVEPPSTVDVNTAMRMRKCWHIPCKFGDRTIEALIDTGAESSIMSRKCFKKLDQDTHTTPVPSKTVFHGIGGDQASYGVADLTYHVGQKQLVKLP